MWIKVLLLGIMVVAVLLFVRRWYGVKMQAGKRIAFFAFIAVNVVAILRPDDVTVVANRLGVGRGADLVLYLLVSAFVLAMLNTYLRFREMDRRYTELSRTLAIREAELVNRERGLLPERHEHAPVLQAATPKPDEPPPATVPASSGPVAHSAVPHGAFPADAPSNGAVLADAPSNGAVPADAAVNGAVVTGAGSGGGLRTSSARAASTAEE